MLRLIFVLFFIVVSMSCKKVGRVPLCSGCNQKKACELKSQTIISPGILSLAERFAATSKSFYAHSSLENFSLLAPLRITQIPFLTLPAGPRWCSSP